jgi:hypothetical protein
MRKIAAILELNAQELKYLLHGLKQLDMHYNAGSRDFNREEMHEKLQQKLEKASVDLK